MLNFSFQQAVGVLYHSYVLFLQTCKVFLCFRAIIISGGPGSVNDANPVWCDPQIFELGIPILGICYGHQVCITEQLDNLSP